MRFLLQVTIGIIREQKHRRAVMFLALVLALLLLFLGSTFLAASLQARPWIFLLFWAACAWLTFLALLLAAYDMITVRKAAREERRRLHQQFLDEKHIS